MRRDAKRQQIAERRQLIRRRLIIGGFVIAGLAVNLLFLTHHLKLTVVSSQKTITATDHANIKTVTLTKNSPKFTSQVIYPAHDNKEIDLFVRQQVADYNNQFFSKISTLEATHLPYEQKINYRVGRDDDYLELAMTIYQDFREEEPMVKVLKWAFDKRTGQNIPEIPTTPAPPDPNKHPIALTFDDGPSQYTDQILMELRKYQARATFFMLGRQAQYHHDLVRRVASEHHQIGNHSVNHTNLLRVSPDQIFHEITHNNQIINSAVPDYKITLFRPPYGNHNQHVKNALQELGMANILWSVDTLDWKTRDAQQICDHVKVNARAGAIVLMHDFYQTTAEAVPCILEFLQANNYQMVTISELLGELHAGEVYRSKE